MAVIANDATSELDPGVVGIKPGDGQVEDDVVYNVVDGGLGMIQP